MGLIHTAVFRVVLSTRWYRGRRVVRYHQAGSGAGEWFESFLGWLVLRDFCFL